MSAVDIAYCVFMPLATLVFAWTIFGPWVRLANQERRKQKLMTQPRVDLDKLDAELEKWRGEVSLPVEVVVSMSEELRASRAREAAQEQGTRWCHSCRDTVQADGSCSCPD